MALSNLESLRLRQLHLAEISLKLAAVPVYFFAEAIDFHNDSSNSGSLVVIN
jgi:hypothetical protein